MRGFFSRDNASDPRFYGRLPTTADSTLRIREHDISLTGGEHQASDEEIAMARRYNSVIPFNAVHTHFATLAPKLNVKRLEKSHVLDVLQRRYPRYVPVLRTLDEIIPIESAVSRVQANVCAIAKGKGTPFASGLLIANDLLLTARHCVEEIDVGRLSVCLGYQLTEQGLPSGERIPIESVLESDSDLDYVIVKLSQPITNFVPVEFSFVNSHDDESILIHHPSGGPKKVSVHASMQSQYYQYRFSAFHDSWKGSSGAVYIDARGRIFALHTMFNHGGTNATWMQSIYEASPLFQAVLNLSPSSVTVYPSTYLRSTLKTRSQYHEVKLDNRHLFLHPLDKIGPFFAQKTYFDQERHHIIPDGDMQFLWLLGRECPKLGKLLTSMCYQILDEEDDERDSINVIEWAPWNIFVGPGKKNKYGIDTRADDPHDGDIPEKVRPPSFNEDLWAALKVLHKQIDDCWYHRQKLFQRLNDGVPSDWAGYRGRAIPGLARYHRRTAIENPDNLVIQQELRRSLKRQYADAISAMVPTLKRIQHAYAPIQRANRTNYMHQTETSDWELLPSTGQVRVKSEAVRMQELLGPVLRNV